VRSFRDLNATAAKVKETNYDSDAGPNYLNNLQNSPLARWLIPLIRRNAWYTAFDLHVTDQLRP
jgi:hypothetical protein